jgi:phosphodiesterase/alkaline phosphatase D-like protein
MPIDDSGDPSVMYRSFRWGKDVELFMLDGRSFRSESSAGTCTEGGQPDPLPGAALLSAPESLRGIREFVGLPAELPPGCRDSLDDPARTLLGAEQKQWLKDQLAASTATWKIVANPVPVQSLLVSPYDRWEGYAAERREILEFIRDEAIDNVVFLATDFHANIFGPVRIDPFDSTPPVAYEAVTGPIATAPLQQEIVSAVGEGTAGVLGAFFTGVIGVDCAELDSFAYSVVEADAESMRITAKDDSGEVLCDETLEAKP